MRDIKGYEGLYAITSCGKVWSYRRKIFMKLSNDKNGYLLVNLSKDGKHKMFRVHRLVAEAYIPNSEEKPQVNHKDEIKYHNYINNLEWMTPKENSNYGTRKERAAKSCCKPVYCIELDKIFSSLSTAAKELGLSAGNISNCCKSKTKTVGGYHWRYVEEVGA